MSDPVADLNQALALARQVRSLLRRAGAPRSHQKAVRLCTSIGGAVRHALRIAYRRPIDGRGNDPHNSQRLLDERLP